jgi:hypothetical protein
MRKRQPLGWGRPLPTPIKLRDGHVIETMAQAAIIMTERLPKKRQLTAMWQKTAQMLMDAHSSRTRHDLDQATAQLRRAFACEGWGT